MSQSDVINIVRAYLAVLKEAGINIDEPISMEVMPAMRAQLIAI